MLSAYSVSNEIGARSTGLPNIKKTWIHSGAIDPHQNHIPLDGVTVGIDDTFNVGGHQARYPRDTSLPASESIGCMCAVAYRSK